MRTAAEQSLVEALAAIARLSERDEFAAKKARNIAAGALRDYPRLCREEAA
jgi:hypothetical protein